MKNKKGQATIFMIFLLIALFMGVIISLVGGLAVTKMNEVLDVSLEVGQTNLSEVNALTFGKYNEMWVVSADWWGMSLIFGLILGLTLSAYFVRGTFPKWGLILDIFIILGIFIASLYLSASYQTLIDALADAGETYLEDTIPRTSMFILNLPIFIVIIGALMMILFHGALPRKTEEKIQAGGFLQGI